jgi:uncharacterized BrkB/YihY/UPF0761 family membrane protein
VAAEQNDPQPDAEPPPDTEPDTESTPDSELPEDAGRIARARQTIIRTGERVREARGHSETIDSAFLLVEHDINVGGGVLAGAVAYRLFLFIVPLVFFLVYGIGLGASASGQSASSVTSGLSVGGFVAKAVTAGAVQSDTSRITIFVVAGFATVIGAHSFLKVIRIVHGLVWRVGFPKGQHSWRGTGLFIAVIVAALVASASIGRIDRTSQLGVVASVILIFGIAFGVWLLISWRMPHADGIPWTALIPGAILFGAGVVILRFVTIYFFDNYLLHKSTTYGAVAGSLVLLLWVYILGRILIGSVVLNSTLASRPAAPR